MKMLTIVNHAVAVAAVSVFGAGVLGFGNVAAQSLSDEWRFRAVVYMWGAGMSGKATFPGGNTADIDVSFRTLIEHLNMAGMGSLEAQKGSWGAFTDVVYLNVGGTKTTTHDHTIDGVPLPVGVTSNVALGVKAWVWTLAGSYGVQSGPDSEMDVFAGARLLSIEPTLSYQFSADVGPFVGPSRAGSRTVKKKDWDAIAGVKGRVSFGAQREWFIPYYVDIGTGDSDFTWQGVAGIGYRYPWGDVIATWRYLDYKFKSSSKVDDLTMNGPLLGVALHW